MTTQQTNNLDLKDKIIYLIGLNTIATKVPLNELCIKMDYRSHEIYRAKNLQSYFKFGAVVAEPLMESADGRFTEFVSLGRASVNDHPQASDALADLLSDTGVTSQVKHFEEIDGMLRNVFFNSKFQIFNEVDYQEYIEMIFTNGGMSYEKLSKDIEDGIKNGFPIGQQIRMAEDSLKKMFNIK